MKTCNRVFLAALLAAALSFTASQAMAQHDATWKGRGLPEPARFTARSYYSAPRVAVAPWVDYAPQIAVAESPSATERRTFSAEPGTVTPPIASAPQVRRSYSYQPVPTYRAPVSMRYAPARAKYELQKADPRKYE